MNDNIFLLAKNGNKDAIELVISTVKPFIFKQCGKMLLLCPPPERLKQSGAQWTPNKPPI